MSTLVIQLLSTLVLASDAAILLLLLLIFASVFSKSVRRLKDKFIARTVKYVLFFAFAVSVVATLGSLYFSEILHYVPCELCWFQRIFMYPQALMFGIAIFRKDVNIFKYAVPMSIIGGLISVYNYSLQLMPSQAAACFATGVSCAASQFFSYGYITITFMALTGFALIVTSGLISTAKTQ